MSRDSLEEETSFSSSLDSLIPNVVGGINCVEILMPRRILFDQEVQANPQMIEHVKSYIKHYLRIDN